MASKHTLKVAPRQLTGRKVRKLRSQGVVPANIFGKGVKSVNIQVPGPAFGKLFAEVGESTLIYLEIEGEKEDRPVLVREVTRHPLTGALLHIDFNQVNLKEKVTAPVAVELVGEAPAETEKLGILVQQLDELEIEALPTDMPEKIEVGVTNLKAVDEAIKVGDIKVSDQLVVKTDPEQIVAKIDPLAVEEVQPAAAPEAPAPVEGEAAPNATPETPAAES